MNNNSKLLLEHLEKRIDREDDRDKNFETKANYIIALSIVLYGMVVKDINIKIFENESANKIMWLIIVSGLAYSIYCSLKVLNNREYKYINVDDITGNHLEMTESKFCEHMAIQLIKNIQSNKETTDNKAKWYHKGITSLLVILMIITISIIVEVI